MRPEKAKQEHPPRSPRRVAGMEAACVLLAVLALLSILLAAWLDEQSGGAAVYLPYGMAAGILLLIPAVILLIRVTPDQRRLTCTKVRKRAEKLPLSVLPGAGGLRELLRRRRFDEILPGVFSEGWFSGSSGDRIRHYILFLESGSLEEASAALPGRIKAAHGWEPGVCCIIPVLCQQEVTEQDRAALREQAARFYARASAGLGSPVLPVLVERRSGQGWYLERRWTLSGYGSGCRFLRRMKRQLQKNAPTGR